jgi:negative regulator of flagellin synthesis FlgM
MAVDIVGTGFGRSDVSSKISGVDNGRTGPVGAGRAVERSRDTTTGQKPSEQGSDGVHITGTARHLLELEQMVKDMPAVDEAKVAAIAASIEQGTYKVSGEKVADSLMQIEQALAPLTGKR